LPPDQASAIASKAFLRRRWTLQIKPRPETSATL